MQPIKPNVVIDGDSHDNIMARSGVIVGYSKTRIVWQYGFMPDSDMARAFNVSLPAFHWVIATYSGKVLDSFEGFAYELPERYRYIIESR